jgi:hypothetical protein
VSLRLPARAADGCLDQSGYGDIRERSRQTLEELTAS